MASSKSKDRQVKTASRLLDTTARPLPAGSRGRAQPLHTMGAATGSSGPTGAVPRREGASAIPKAAGAVSKRPAWDMKGRVADLTTKLARAQSDAESAERENALLKASLSERCATERSLEEQLERMKSQISEAKVQQKAALEEKRKGERLSAELDKWKGQFLCLHQKCEATATLLTSQQAELKGLLFKTSLSERNLERFRTQLRDTEEDLVHQRAEDAHLPDEVRASRATRHALEDRIHDLKGNIRVLCRVRPPVDGEMSPHIRIPAQDMKPTTLTLIKPEEVTMTEDRQKPYLFRFGQVLGPHVSQEEVFEEISLPIQSVLDGRSVCCVAFGQTGSGKSYTMVGGATAESRGIVPRAVQQLLHGGRTRVEEQGWQYSFKVSLVDVCEETVRDLLASVEDEGARQEVSKVTVTSEEEVRHVMDVARQRRVSAGSSIQQPSSAGAHSLFHLDVHGTHPGRRTTHHSSLCLVDVTGSVQTQDTLVRAIAALVDKDHLQIPSGRFAFKDGPRNPSRRIKLLQVLQGCLGGQQKVKMIMLVHVSPEWDSFEDTLSSLRLASKMD